MAIQIICNVIMFINLAIATGLLIFDLVKLPKKCECIFSWENINGQASDKFEKFVFKRAAKLKGVPQGGQIKDDTTEKYKKVAFQNTLSFISLKLFLPLVVSILTCFFDGLDGILQGDGDQPYLPVFITVFLVSAVVVVVGLRIYFRILENKYGFHYRFVNFWSNGETSIVPLMIGILYGIIVGQAVYTIYLMCVL